MDQAFELDKLGMLPPFAFPYSREELAGVFDKDIVYGLFSDDRLIGKLHYENWGEGD